MAEVMTPALLRAAALAAREDAVRLRRDSGSQRTELQRTMRIWRRRRRRGWETSRANVDLRRDLRYRSAWSDLDWQLPDKALDRVLVRYDRES